MIKFLMSKTFIFVLSALAASSASAYFRDEQDAKISLALVSQFKVDCAHKTGVDQSRIIEIQIMYERSQKDKTEISDRALKCYQDRMSQIIGTHQLYKQLCDEVSDEKTNRPEQDTLRLMLMTQRYRKGIGPFHDLLNDCLVEHYAQKYLVPVVQRKTEGATLKQQLEAIEVKRPVEPNRWDFR